jgi:hypothetical protein
LKRLKTRAEKSPKPKLAVMGKLSKKMVDVGGKAAGAAGDVAADETVATGPQKQMANRSQPKSSP